MAGGEGEKSKRKKDREREKKKERNTDKREPVPAFSFPSVNQTIPLTLLNIKGAAAGRMDRRQTVGRIAAHRSHVIRNGPDRYRTLDR